MKAAKAWFGCAVSMLAAAARAEETSGTATGATVRVGIYDSRSIAVASAGSEASNRRLSALAAEYEKAKAGADRKRMAELEAEGSGRQKLMHQQAFSTAPVDNILEQIKDRLPAIMANAGVSALVSKWDKAGLARHKGAQLVDVTPALVDAFHPSDRQRQRALEIQKHDPISLEQAGSIDD